MDDTIIVEQSSKPVKGHPATVAFLESFKSFSLIEMETSIHLIASVYGKLFLKRLKEAYKGKL